MIKSYLKYPYLLVCFAFMLALFSSCNRYKMQPTGSSKNYVGSQLVIQKIDSNSAAQIVEIQSSTTSHQKVNTPNNIIRHQRIAAKFTKKMSKVDGIDVIMPKVVLKKNRNEPKSWIFYCGGSTVLLFLASVIQSTFFNVPVLVFLSVIIYLISIAFCIIGIVHLGNPSRYSTKKKEIEKDKKREDIDIY
ncbi:MAG: hypothetical protein SGJ04_03620 [Bacteroidota bacterium]|nr:hypothetical protein [Bacteroidota bacterium]